MIQYNFQHFRCTLIVYNTQICTLDFLTAILYIFDFFFFFYSIIIIIIFVGYTYVALRESEMPFLELREYRKFSKNHYNIVK